jgi:hypothetical protein
MRRKPYLALILVVLALTIGIELCNVLFIHRRNPSPAVSVYKKEYQLKHLEITRGTKHIIYGGSSVAADLKEFLCNTGVGPAVQLGRRIPAQKFSRTTSSNTALLWFGFTPRNYNWSPTNSGPDLACFISQPGGRTAQMHSVGGYTAPKTKEVVEAWELPGNFNSFSGCTVQVREWKDSPHRLEDVATIRL